MKEPINKRQFEIRITFPAIEEKEEFEEKAKAVLEKARQDKSKYLYYKILDEYEKIK